MQPLYKIKTILSHMFVRTQILVDLPKILQSFLIIASRRGILEKYLHQNPREENENGWKRERVENQVA